MNPKTVLLSTLLLMLAACGEEDTGTVGGPDGDGGSTSDGGSDGGGGDGGAVATESECEDGRDNDDDGAIDCLDSDCTASWNCNLPDSMSFESLFDFAGNTIECEAWGIEFDVDVDDCRTEASSTLARIDGGPMLCDVCDETYSGALTYITDSCSELLEMEPLTVATYGFVFVDELTRDLYAEDEKGRWTFVETLTSPNGARWEISGSDAIIADPEDCDNGDQNLGTLTIALTFRDD